MATQPRSAKGAEILESLRGGLGQFRDLNPNQPGQTETKDYYAELPIAIRVSGRFHDIGAFAADIAALSRIVTLHNLNIVPGAAAGTLSMDATARTYRYLDPAEVAEVRKGAKK
jgi:type IV pilus assembly protein PilO